MTTDTSQSYPLGDNPPADATPKWAQEMLTRLWYVQSQVRDLGKLEDKVDKGFSKLDERFSKLDERLTDLATDRWFARTIDRTGYRPEPRRMEPVPGTWGEEWEHPSPYRR